MIIICINFKTNAICHYFSSIHEVFKAKSEMLVLFVLISVKILDIVQRINKMYYKRIDQILDLVAHGYDECPVFCPGPVHRAQASWASPLGISSGHQVANDAKTISGTTGKSRNSGLFGRIGWGTWIRTRTNGVRAPGKILFLLRYFEPCCRRVAKSA